MACDHNTRRQCVGGAMLYHCGMDRVLELAATRRGSAGACSPNAARKLADPHLQACGMWRSVCTADGRAVRSPRNAARPRPPWRVAGARGFPAGGGQGGTVKCELEWRTLRGARILDLTHVWAGLLATPILADLGARGEDRSAHGPRHGCCWSCDSRCGRGNPACFSRPWADFSKK